MLCYNESTPFEYGHKQSRVGIAEGCIPHKFNETEDLKMGKIIVAEKIMDFRLKNNLTQGEFGNLLGAPGVHLPRTYCGSPSGFRFWLQPLS